MVPASSVAAGAGSSSCAAPPGTTTDVRTVGCKVGGEEIVLPEPVVVLTTATVSAGREMVPHARPCCRREASPFCLQCAASSLPSHSRTTARRRRGERTPVPPPLPPSVRVGDVVGPIDAIGLNNSLVAQVAMRPVGAAAPLLAQRAARASSATVAGSPARVPRHVGRRLHAQSELFVPIGSDMRRLLSRSSARRPARWARCQPGDAVPMPAAGRHAPARTGIRRIRSSHRCRSERPVPGGAHAGLGGAARGERNSVVLSGDHHFG